MLLLNSGSGGPGWSPCQSHRVVFLGKTLYSCTASLDPGVYMRTGEFNAGEGKLPLIHKFLFTLIVSTTLKLKYCFNLSAYRSQTYKQRQTYLELMSCCKRNDLTTGLLSVPNSGNGENSFVSRVDCDPVTNRMSISNISGSKSRTSSPKQNTDTISMKNALQR